MICCETEMVIRNEPDHYECTRCGSHDYRGKRYTRQDWFFVVNQATFAGCDIEDTLPGDFDSPHAHEIINHSDPEKI